MGRTVNPLTPEACRLLLAKSLLLVDLECTCGLGVPNERDVQEIIEIGMWLGSEEDWGGVRRSQHSLFVRPQHTVVNDFCTRLTGITAGAISGEPVFSARVKWLQSTGMPRWGAEVWSSWGEFDKSQFQRQCDREGLENPLAAVPHVNAKAVLKPALQAIAQERGGSFPKGARRGVGLGTALTLLGMEFVGRPHSGADDAFNAARVIHAVRAWAIAGGHLPVGHAA